MSVVLAVTFFYRSDRKLRNTHSTRVTSLQLVNMSVTHIQENFPCLTYNARPIFYEIIDVKNGLQFLRTNARFIKAVKVTFEPYFSGTKTEFYLLILQQIT